MAIEKMVLLNLVGSLEKEHDILEQLVLCENVHLNAEHQGDVYDNNYMVHEYEMMIPSYTSKETRQQQDIEARYREIENTLLEVSSGLEVKGGLIPRTYESGYTIDQAECDLNLLQQGIGDKIILMSNKQKMIDELKSFRHIASAITQQELSLDELTNLNYFEYEMGLMSHENKLQIKKNYENISAVVLQIGALQDSREDIYIVIYPQKFKEETQRLLKSLNWVKIEIPEGVSKQVSNMLASVDQKITQLEIEKRQLRNKVLSNEGPKAFLLNKIYTRLRIEQKILQMKEHIVYGNNVFILNVWIPEDEKDEVEECIANITDKYVAIIKQVSELGKEVVPPTKLKNNWIFRPFETVVKLYGLPSYCEVDPTPFLAITFCLMFGIMFGDIGQGLVYFVAGLVMYKKSEVVGGVLTRLGTFSIAFGFVYGSLFGLEQHELPWLPSLIGSPLSTRNIPLILLMGVGLGVVVLTISFVFGMINALRKNDIEEGIFGKNGLVGYMFFMGLIMTVITLVKVIPISPSVPLAVMGIMLIIMIFKEPLANMIQGKKPYIHGEKSAYFVESGFEGIETILNALSNAISFIRVGAFALNHAGLFMAFLVMSEMTENIVLKIIILVLGNILILSLEGLVVFIQGLRLQYYEMFSKYFVGDGIEYNPITLEDHDY